VASPLLGQTVAYQFDVLVAFDGATLANNAVQTSLEDQFYEARQKLAGIFPINDPGPQQADTSRGNRWLTWIELRLDSPASPGALIEIVDNSSGSIVALKTVADIAGKSIVYLDAGALVPQGSSLRVSGAGSGLLRYHVTFLDPQGLALLASLSLALQKKATPASGLEVRDDGLLVVPLALTMNFTGAGVTATQTGPNIATVDIPGGALPPTQEAFFLDNTTLDIPVGTTASGEICVDANISKDNGESTSFRFTFGISATGVGLDCLGVDSDIPLTDIETSSALSGINVILRLTGSGVGVNTGIIYRIISTLPRLL
jgi:hypothetical protein